MNPNTQQTAAKKSRAGLWIALAVVLVVLYFVGRKLQKKQRKSASKSRKSR